MKKYVCTVLTVLGVILCFSPCANADWFGGDDMILSQILQNAVSQLAELRSILNNGSNTLGLLQNINQGINDSLELANSLGVPITSGVYGNLQNAGVALSDLENIYGKPVDSPLEPSEEHTDKTVAEAISFNNQVEDYTERLDEIGENIKRMSEVSSPGRDEKITAASMGVIINVLSEQMRATGEGLKLQAQGLAIKNKEQKDSAREYMNETTDLSHEMASTKVKFNFPRF